jgi:hypothetical protein
LALRASTIATLEFSRKTIAGIEYLANANKFGHIHRVNALLGLRTSALVTPLQLLEKDDENETR